MFDNGAGDRSSQAICNLAMEIAVEPQQERRDRTSRTPDHKQENDEAFCSVSRLAQLKRSPNNARRETTG
jgi:hypothetical protein